MTPDDDDPHRPDDRGDDSDDLKDAICCWIEAAKVLKDAMKRGLSAADLPPYSEFSSGQLFSYPASLRYFTIALFHKLSHADIAAPTDDVEDYVTLVMSWVAGAPVTPHDAVEAFTRAELLLYRIGIIAAARPVGPATTVPTGVTDAAGAFLTDEDRRLNPPRDQGSEAPAATPGPGIGGEPSPLLPQRGRKTRRKNSARLLLVAALDSLAEKGQWGKTDTEIIETADIARDSFYRLTRSDEGIKSKLAEYRRQTLGRGPARARDL